jgi:catechol 2,3-dioxygenase-like lactoylglutathione lyase family enzyme
MNTITIHQAMLPHEDADASLAFYRDTLGFEVRNVVEYGGMHWITVGPAPRSSSTRRVPRPASPTTSAARSPR